jgi:hypothetical protein
LVVLRDEEAEEPDEAAGEEKVDAGGGVSAEELEGEDEGGGEDSLECDAFDEEFGEEDGPGEEGHDVHLGVVEPDDVEAAEHEGGGGEEARDAAEVVAAGEDVHAEPGGEEAEGGAEGPAPGFGEKPVEEDGRVEDGGLAVSEEGLADAGVGIPEGDLAGAVSLEGVVVPGDELDGLVEELFVGGDVVGVAGVPGGDELEGVGGDEEVVLFPAVVDGGAGDEGEEEDVEGVRPDAVAGAGRFGDWGWRRFGRGGWFELRYVRLTHRTFETSTAGDIGQCSPIICRET